MIEPWSALRRFTATRTIERTADGSGAAEEAISLIRRVASMASWESMVELEYDSTE
jgi:hypothetical protein